MAVQQPVAAATPAGKTSRLDEGPVVVEVRGVEKSFRVPTHRIDSLKERVSHPLTRTEYRTLRALKEISFDIHHGEFFGIVGRNGSGKSTLLKILASIYRADAGTIRMAGRVAPFIELGVGLNPELTAAENAKINGVMMGLTRREAGRRLDSILDFAELRDFVELKLKNYSSGMMVRLAFAVMVQADADIMLIDEVLAVGDAAFAQKCMDIFQARRREGKTVVLVTHDMSTVESLCHRAMLIEDGELRYVGEPDETAIRYLRLNFAGEHVQQTGLDRAVSIDLNARVVHARLCGEDGEPIENLEAGAPINLDLLIEARRALAAPLFIFHVVSEDGVVVFEFINTLDLGAGEQLGVGDRVRVAGQIVNSLVPGRYSVHCWIRQDHSQRDMALQAIRLFDFVVYGTAPRHGLVTVQADVTATPEPGSRG